MFSKSKIIILSILALLSFSAYKTADEYFEISKNLEIFSSVYKEINNSYVDDINAGKLMKTAIDAMLKSLDPYTNFYSESQVEDALIQRSGEYGGIGLSLENRNGNLIVTDVFEGFSAAKNDIRIGDIITHLNGANFVGKSIAEASEILKGTIGNKISLTVKRENNQIQKELTREEIKLKNVSYSGMIDEHIGIVKLEHFREGAAEEIRTSIDKLKENKGFDKLILDLRDNGGGLLFEAVKIVNLFIPKNKLVVTTKGKNTENTNELKTINESYNTEIPIIVLINNRSASASEIVSGCLQDYDRAVIIGRNSFGKGLVQNTKELPYRTQMKVTTAKYYIPSGRCIQLLDYSKRNSDGSAGFIPDSLRKPFKTSNNRIVYDGGGVKPDIKVDLEKQNPFLSKLISENFIFDFATSFRNQNSSISDPKIFKLNEVQFDEFKNWVISKKIDYKTSTEDFVNKIKTSSKEEGYFSGIENEINLLEKKLKNEKSSDIDKNKKEVINILETEISRRYFFERAIIENSFNKDKDILKSKEVFGNLNAYKKILSGN